ncbi:MAG: hypothetical protein H7A35_08700 [Planctomycetales bacterium]|nr:hypothetical protein [bacterium]UNM06962.1 MAG: hypothetical protein H7A35_08700 [Planctomycetales bacterium]
MDVETREFFTKAMTFVSAFALLCTFAVFALQYYTSLAGNPLLIIDYSDPLTLTLILLPHLCLVCLLLLEGRLLPVLMTLQAVSTFMIMLGMTMVILQQGEWPWRLH